MAGQAVAAMAEAGGENATLRRMIEENQKNLDAVMAKLKGLMPAGEWRR